MGLVKASRRDSASLVKGGGPRQGKPVVPTNADRVLHHTAKVTETIDNENTTGAVYIDGKTWTARSEDGDVIARGSMVTIVRMEGVKLFVRKEREEP